MNGIHSATYLLSIIAFVLSTHIGISQCAGEDNSVTICNKYDDVDNRTFNLFSSLNGTSQTGGTWSAPYYVNSDALDTATGVLNLWLVNYHGSHEFTYTNCGESATVTITLGGYAGEDNTDGSANTCSDQSEVNMFNFLGSSTDGEIPDFNGKWAEDSADPTRFLFGNFFNAEAAGPGEYIFTYTVPEVDTCMSMQSTVHLEVHQGAEPGNPSAFIVCATNDLSGYTNLDLHNYLAGEDSNGTWNEDATNQLQDQYDHHINVAEIYANFGYGLYKFSYTVIPEHPACLIRTITVPIYILPTLKGNLLNSYCTGSDYEVTLEYDQTLIPSDTYEITYRISSSLGTEDITETVELNDGTWTFNIPTTIVPGDEIVEVSIVTIEQEDEDALLEICRTIEVSPINLLISNPLSVGESVCINNPVDIELQNIFDLNGNPSNETHSVSYILSFPDDTSTEISIGNLDFTNGKSSFTIPFSNLEVAGTYAVQVLVEDRYNSNCIINTNIVIIPTPESIQLEAVVDNNCDATAIDVVIDAPILEDGNYIVDYSVIEQNSMETLTTNTINFIGGVAQYEIDIATLPDGDYLVSLKSTQNDTTPCREVFEYEHQESFTIGGTPIVLDIPDSQIFCLNEGIPTLADIAVDPPENIAFYQTAVDNVPLPLSTILIDGEDYFAYSTDNYNCLPETRSRVVISLIEASIPTSENLSPVLCGSQNPILADLEAQSITDGTILWYASNSSDSPLDITEPLIDGQSYFAVERLNGFCESETRLEIIPEIINPPLPGLTFNELKLCALDNPTVARLENMEIEIEGVLVKWFLTGEGGEALSQSDLLVDDTVYYAQSESLETGCSNMERVSVLVDLNDCEPEQYGFFIPDGFSPNNDARNDTFHIPNIEVIFPDFTLEIFNRYGNLLFKGDVNNPAWDGSETGDNTASSGTYFYILRFNREGFDPKQGRLYLNR
ncbi:MAG: gliding motility-associated C-terminal domain-containing protein [Flavobacteriaceae bacterium]